MGIYQKDGNWFIDYYANGKRRREKIGTSKVLAETVLRKRKVEIAEGKFLDIKKQEKVKFEDFVDEFLHIYSKPNKKSWKTDYYNLKALDPYFKGCYLYEITPEAVEKFKAKRIKEVSPATVNKEISILKNLLNRAVEWGKIKENVIKGIKLLHEPKGRLRYLEKEEITRLLANASLKLKPILLTAIYTGMRRGEIINLKWHDINFERGIIYLLDTKNGDKREVYMCDLLKKALMAIPKHPGSPYIFADSDGKPPKDIRKCFFTALKKSGIINFRFHDLRHTYASQLVMAGVDINTTRELLGHKDIRMTLRYSHLSPDHKKRAVETLSRQLDTFWTPAHEVKNTEENTILQLIDDRLVI